MNLYLEDECEPEDNSPALSDEPIGANFQSLHDKTSKKQKCQMNPVWETM